MLETQREAVPSNDGGEKDTALAFLDFVRSCALKKVDGLDDEQLRRRLVVSETTLLGLLRHLTDGERYWFSYVVGGDERWAGVEFPMTVEDGRTPDEVVAEYRAAVAESRTVLAARDLDDRTAVPVHGEHRTVRWVVAHMTGETARHAGHADILRELVDGVTGR
jgi:uncharacterized damage-inducible protein DinB